MLIYYGLGTRRGKDLSNELNGEYYKTKIKLRRGSFIKIIDYALSATMDLINIWKYKPRTIIVEFAQSDIMLMVACIVKLFNLNIRIIPDCHTASYIQEGRDIIGFTKTKKNLVDKCNALILHNEETVELNLHKNQFVIESKVPKRNNKNQNSAGKNITFITSCNPDEPFELIFDVSKLMNNEYKFLFTGNYKKLSKELLAKKPKSITGTGYLSESDYNNLINESLVLVVLTERDYTLLYGGREALAYNVPVVLSNNNSNYSFFYKGTVLVENDVNEIVKGINYAIKNRTKLKNELKELNSEKMILWQDRIKKFNQYLIDS